VHVVTVNDYLAQRDAQWMGEIYKFLGLTVGCIVHGLDDGQRREQYACDVTYGTNNELGFDYLRDNMKYHLEEMVQRGHHYAIVDEVDSILIDEARTPLIISGAIEDRSDLYNTIDAFIPRLDPEDYELDEKMRSVTLTDLGNEHMEELLRGADLLQGENLYDIENVTIVHHVNQALRAHKLFQRDRDYIVKDDQVIIIDEFTGRMMPGRRYSEGLHQALEAKERAAIQPENQTLASVTFQNYFRLYEKLAGMTGTAATEADEFMDIYKLDVVEIPTNLPVARTDEDDEVYRTAKEKYDAIVELIADCRKRGQPVLVGTTSIEKSEQLSALLKRTERGAQRAQCPLSRAGGPDHRPGRRARHGDDRHQHGRARHRHPARRQRRHADQDRARPRRNSARRSTPAGRRRSAPKSRSRRTRWSPPAGCSSSPPSATRAGASTTSCAAASGRQGDPGRSRFFLSLEDDLMRIFGSERMDSMLQKLGLQEGEAIVHPWINKALEKAQQKVEARNFDARKNLLKFDNVMNDQRKVIFEQRIEIMRGEDVPGVVEDMRHEVIADLVTRHIPPNAYAEQWDAVGLREKLRETVAIDFPVEEWAAEEGIADEEIRTRVEEAAAKLYASKREKYGAEIMGLVEKEILLRSLDNLWRDHLLTLEHLRQAVGMRGYGQRDPLNEYKTEAFTLFEALLQRLREVVTGQLMRVEIGSRAPVDQLPSEDELPPMQAHHVNPFTGRDEAAEAALALGQPQFGRFGPGMAGLGGGQRAGNAKGSAARRRPQRSRILGQGRTQRDLPVRLRQEVQALPRNRLAGLLPVGGEHFDALVGERVLDQALQRCRRHGGDVGAGERGHLHVIDGADRSGEDLGAEVVVVEDRADLLDDLHAVHPRCRRAGR
jgi:preprotein translocase subunit SecA